MLVLLEKLIVSIIKKWCLFSIINAVNAHESMYKLGYGNISWKLFHRYIFKLLTINLIEL